jgi:multidrug efflux pump
VRLWKGRAAACGDPLLAIALLLGGFNLYGQFGKGLLSSLRSSLISSAGQVRARDNFSSERDAWCARSNRLLR